MSKSEWIMGILLVILMVTGCLFSPLADYYNLIKCIHSLAALILCFMVVIHAKNRFRTAKGNKQ